MRNLLSSLILSLTAVSCDMPEPVTEPKYIKFFEWLNENGAIYDGIELRKSSESMRGVYAIRDFKEDEVLIFVPDKLIHSYEKAL